MDYPRSDRWGRPLILPVAGTEEIPHTRATTIAKTLDDGTGLANWKQLMAVAGAIQRPDIRAQVEANWPPTPETKAKLRRCVDELREAAAASAGANLGDALHAMTARIDVGEDFVPFPPFDADIDAYRTLIADADIRIFPEYVERTVVLGDLRIAGSFDRLVGKAGQLFVFDLKTGKNLELAWPSIAVQLALYSRGETLYDWETRTHEPMPTVNQRQGLVLWLPAGTGEASLHVVDLEAGWEAAQHAFWVREWRKRKDLARAARTQTRSA